MIVGLYIKLTLETYYTCRKSIVIKTMSAMPVAILAVSQLLAEAWPINILSVAVVAVQSHPVTLNHVLLYSHANMLYNKLRTPMDYNSNIGDLRLSILLILKPICVLYCPRKLS